MSFKCRGTGGRRGVIDDLELGYLLCRLWQVEMLISPALAYHGTAGSGTTMGAILPLIVVAAALLFALVFWGRKKGRKQQKRKRRRDSRRNKR